MLVKRLFVKYCLGYLAIVLLGHLLSFAVEFISEDVFMMPLVGLIFVSIFYPSYAISKIFDQQLGDRIWAVFSKITPAAGLVIIGWLSFDTVFGSHQDPWYGLIYIIVTLLAGIFLSCIFVGYAAISIKQYRLIRLMGLMILVGSAYSILVFLGGILEIHNIKVLNALFYWPAGITVALALFTLLLSVFVGLKPEFENKKGRMLDAAS